MKTFQYTFGAGETKVFPGGKFFILISAAAGVDVDYLRNGTSVNENAEGVVSGYYYESPNEFTSVRVTSGTAQTVTLAISRGTGGYNVSANVLAGGSLDSIVNPVDVRNWRTGDIATEAGTEGMGFADAITSGTSKTSVYLKNPTGSGRNIYLHKFIVSVEDQAGTPAAHHTLYVERGVGNPGVAGSAMDKRANVFSVVGVTSGLSSAGAFGVQKFLRVRDRVEIEYIFNTPERIVPGRYFGLGTNVVNQNTYGHFEWYERTA